VIKKIIIYTVLFIALLVGSIIFLHWRTNVITNLIRDILTTQIEGVTSITYTTLRGDLLQRVFIENLEVTLQDSSRLQCAYMQVNYSLFSAISSHINVRSLIADSLYIYWHGEGMENSREEERNKTIRSVLSGLPNVHIGNLEVTHAQIRSNTPSFSLDSLLLTLRLSIKNDKISMNLEELSGKWIEKNIWLKNLSFELKGQSDKLTVNRFRMLLPSSYLEAHGEVNYTDSLWAILSIDKSLLSIDEINSIISLPQMDSGYVKFSTEVIGSLDNFRGRAQLQAYVNKYKIDNLTVTGMYQNGKITIEQGQLFRSGGSVHFSGTYSTSGGTIIADIEKIDVGSLIEGTLPTSLNGKAKFNLVGMDQGTSQISLYHSVIDSAYIDTVYISLVLRHDTLLIDESTYVKFGEKANIALSGTIYQQEFLNLKFSTENTPLASGRHFFKLPEINGMVDANLFITGSLKDPNVRGFVWFPHLSYQDIGMDSLILQLQLDNILTHRKGIAHFSMVQCTYKKIKMMEVMMNTSFDSNRVSIDTLVFFNNNNYIATTGNLIFDHDVVNLVFDFFRIHYQGYWLENNNPLNIHFSPEEYILEQAKFKAPDNTAMEIRGFYETDLSNLQLGIDLTYVPLEPFNQFLKEIKIDLAGRLSGDLILLIDKQNVNIDGMIRGEDFKLNSVPFGNIECLFALDHGILSLSKFRMENDSSQVSFNGSLDLRVSESDALLAKNDFYIAFTNLDLATYLPLFHEELPVTGNITGDLHLTGSLTAPKGNLLLEMKDISYQKYTSKALLFDLTLTPDTLYVDSIRGDLNQTDFTIKGNYAAHINLLKPDTLFGKRPLDLCIACEDDRLDFIGVLSDQVEYLRGPFRSEIQIEGPLESPLIKSGYFKMSDGILVLSRIQDPITDVEINAEIEDGILTLKEFTGYSEEDKDFIEQLVGFFKRMYRIVTGRFKPEGFLTCTGSIDLRTITSPVYDLSVKADNFYINYFVENTRLYLNTDNLRISGKDTTLVVGDLTVKPGQYVVDMAKLQKNVYLTESTLERESALALNIHVIIPGNFIISSSELDMQNNFKFEISGEIHTILEPFASEMELTGSLDILPGKYTMFGQSFNILNGTINFTNPHVINPEIYLFAEKMSRDYRVELTITGKMDALQQSIRVLDPSGNYMDNLSEKEKLSILSFGTTDISGGSLVDAGVNVLSTSVQTAVERGAESLTGLDKIEFNSEEPGIDNRAFQLNNGLGDVSFSLGKYLTHNLYVEYSSRFGSGSVPVPKLSWEAGNNIGLQYKIGRNWSIDSKVSQIETGNIYRISLGWKKAF
jgi:autotransporter translocation and assembly factor TamB